MIKISKQEATELEKLGHKFGTDGKLHHTYTKHKTYYLTESEQALTDLEAIREKRKIK